MIVAHENHILTRPSRCGIVYPFARGQELHAGNKFIAVINFSRETPNL